MMATKAIDLAMAVTSSPRATPRREQPRDAGPGAGCDDDTLGWPHARRTSARTHARRGEARLAARAPEQATRQVTRRGHRPAASPLRLLLTRGRGELARVEGEGLSLRQTKVDTLSRRGQGKPGSEEIDDVVSGMKGSFTLEDEVIRFRSMTFGVPGANVDLQGRETTRARSCASA